MITGFDRFVCDVDGHPILVALLSLINSVLIKLTWTMYINYPCLPLDADNHPSTHTNVCRVPVWRYACIYLGSLGWNMIYTNTMVIQRYTAAQHMHQIVRKTVPSSYIWGPKPRRANGRIRQGRACSSLSHLYRWWLSRSCTFASAIINLINMCWIKF